MNIDKPLVTICMMTYNQEKYVKEALLSVLNQSYDNLEIIISDDCSKDGTWAIIETEVDRYLGQGGMHRNILLNRNQKNVGVAKNFELILSKCHGELVVCQAGDDISMLDRVERIVQAWERHPDAMVFCHGAYHINPQGNRTSNAVVRTDALFPMGAMMAYSERVFKEFETITESGAWEDDVYSHRALMLGDAVQIDEPLLLYRIGGEGLSSGCGDIVKRRSKVSSGCLSSARQSRIDLEFCRAKIGESKYVKIREMLDWYEMRYKNEIILYNSKNLIERFYNFHKMCSSYKIFRKFKVLIYLRLFLILFLPMCIVRGIRSVRVSFARRQNNAKGD